MSARLLLRCGPYSAWWFPTGYGEPTVQIDDDRHDEQGASVGATREEFSLLSSLVQQVQDRLNEAMVCQHGKRPAEWCDPCRELEDGPPRWSDVEP